MSHDKRHLAGFSSHSAGEKHRAPSHAAQPNAQVVPDKTTVIAPLGETHLAAKPLAGTQLKEANAPLPVMGSAGAGGPQDPREGEDLEESLAFKSLMEMRRKRRQKKIIIGSIVGVLVLVVALVIIVNLMAPKASEETATEATATVTYGNFTESVSANGKARPVSSVMVTPEVEGIIETVNVSEGQNVAAGDVLLTIKNEKLDQDVADAQSALNSAQVAYDSAVNEYNNAVNAYNNTIGLDQAISDWEGTVNTLSVQYNQAKATYESLAVTDPGAEKEATRQALDKASDLSAQLTNAQTTLAELKARRDSAGSAASAVDAANASVASTQAALQQAQTAYNEAVKAADKRTVKAPSAGSVISVNAVAGAAFGSATGASASSTKSSDGLVQIGDLSQMRVSIEVNEVDISNLKTGQQAVVTFSALEGVTCNATVKSIATVATGASGSEGASSDLVTYTVELLIDQPDSRVKPGMSANVTITTQQVNNTLIVPTTALQEGEGKDNCFVTVVSRDKKGKIDGRKDVRVSVVAKGSSESAIKGDISDGDEVLLVTEGDESQEKANG